MAVSKMVVNRQKSARAVVAAISTHAQAAGDGVAKMLGPEQQKAVVGLVQALAKKLDADCSSMVQADEAHTKELSDDADPRNQRDLLAESLRSSLVEMREITSAMFGSDYTSTLGFAGNTPRDPDQLLALGKQVFENSKQHPAPQPRFPGMCYDATYWTDRIESAMEPLDEALTQVAQEKREAEATYLAKTQAIESFDHTFSMVATLASSMLTFAGQPELARKLRPSTRRSGYTEEVAGGSQVADLPPAPPAPATDEG